MAFSLAVLRKPIAIDPLYKLPLGFPTTRSDPTPTLKLFAKTPPPRAVAILPAEVISAVLIALSGFWPPIATDEPEIALANAPFPIAIDVPPPTSQIEIIKLLIDKGGDINASTRVGAIIEDGRTPLYNAAESGRKEIVELLITAGANV